MFIFPEHQHTEFDRVLIEDFKAALAADIVAIADSLFGERTPGSHTLRKHLRYGSKGGLSISKDNGGFKDFDTQESGDVIATVMRGARLSFRDVLLVYGPQYGFDFFSNSKASPDEEATGAGDRERRAAEQVRARAKADAEQAKYNAGQTAKAKSSWTRSSRLSGTLGETYLEQHRCIPRPQQGWPHDVVRFNSFRRSLIVAGTTDDGSIQCIQDVILDGEGRKNAAAKPDKPTTGPRDGAFGRLPGKADGPLLLAEGSETGLSACRASGYETWICFGGIRKPTAAASGRHIIICQDDDNPEKDAKLLEMAREWVAEGMAVSIATPWIERRHDRSDLNDAIKAGGVQAVLERIAAAKPVLPPEPPKPHYPRPTLSGDEASERLRQVMDDWFDEVEENLEARDWIAVETEATTDAVQQDIAARILAKLLRQGVADALERSEERATKAAPRVARMRARRAAAGIYGVKAASGAMPRMQIKGAAGTGKTQAFADAFSKRPALWNRHIVYYVPTLRDAEDVETTVKEALTKTIDIQESYRLFSKPRTMVLRGRQYGNLCHPDRLPLIKQASDKGVKSIYQALCHTSEMGNVAAAWCPFHARCSEKGWVSQYADKGPKLRIMTHARIDMHHPKELALPEPDLIIVDESALSSMTKHTIIEPTLLADRSVYEEATSESPPIQQTIQLAHKVTRAITIEPETITALRKEGITAKELRTAAEDAQAGYDRSAPKLFAGENPKQAMELLKRHKKHDGQFVASIYRQLARDLENGRSESIGIEWDDQNLVLLEDESTAPHPVIRRHGLDNAIGAPMHVALMMLDADANLRINRRLFGQDLVEYDVPAVRNAFTVQVSDRAVATATIISDIDSREGRASRLRGRIAELVRREVSAGQTLLGVPMKVRCALTDEIEGKMEPITEWQGANVTHYGRHRAANDWKDFDTAIVFREQLPPVEAERIYRAVYADDPEVQPNLTGKYTTEKRRHDLRHGVGPEVDVQVHPDPLVQEIVEIHRENAMGQMADRLRLIHRQPDNPGRVLVMSNIPVPGLVVDRLMPLNDVLDGGTIWDRAIQAMPGGVIPLSAEWLTANLEKLFTSRNVATRAIQILQGLNNPTSVYIHYTEVGLLTFYNICYRVAGQTNPSRALISMAVIDPKAELERALGVPVVWFEGHSDPAPQKPAAPVYHPATVQRLRQILEHNLRWWEAFRIEIAALDAGYLADAAVAPPPGLEVLASEIKPIITPVQWTVVQPPPPPPSFYGEGLLDVTEYWIDAHKNVALAPEPIIDGLRLTQQSLIANAVAAVERPEEEHPSGAVVR